MFVGLALLDSLTSSFKYFIQCPMGESAEKVIMAILKARVRNLNGLIGCVIYDSDVLWLVKTLDKSRLVVRDVGHAAEKKETGVLVNGRIV